MPFKVRLVSCLLLLLWSIFPTAAAGIQSEVPSTFSSDVSSPVQELSLQKTEDSSLCILPPTENSDTINVPAFTETLTDLHIQNGESVSYTTISPSFASGPVPEGFYPGNLTLTLTGQIVIEAGGTLSIGTLSLGGQEASPVLTGTLSETALIVVRSGGSLILTDVVLAMEGQGFLIVQEPGASVLLQQTDIPEERVSWSGPLIDNLYDAPEDLWLSVGTPLTADLLPVSMKTTIQDHGNELDTEVLLSWDLSQYDGRTDGTLTLSGCFVDESGQVLSSLLPLEITVNWYTPELLIVTDAEWKGDTVPVVQLAVLNMPEDADVWGETSVDGGETWTRWDQEDLFFIAPSTDDNLCFCIFSLSDDTPRLFRIVAENTLLNEYWCSESFLLSPPESDDTEGNRGGSTTPTSPDREPDVPDNTLPLDLAEKPEKYSPHKNDESQEPSDSPVEDSVSETAPPEDEPAVEETGVDSDSSESAVEPTSLEEESAPEEAQEPLPLFLQLLFVLIGVALCFAIALAVVRAGPFRRK